MARATNGPATRARRKKILNQASGYYGSKHALYRTAKEQVKNSLAYAYRDRKVRKRQFRKLWIARINAAVRPYNLSYSTFMHGLKLAKIEINRKMLSELAINNHDEFKALVDVVKKAQAKA